MNEASTPLFTLSISCVYYDTHPVIFEKTLNSLAKAIEFATTKGLIQSHEVHFINNNAEKEIFFLEAINKYKDQLANIIIHNGHGNIGYGKANNLAIKIITSTYHLILNPDVEVAYDALAIGIDHLKNHPDTGLVAPFTTNEKNEIEYIAKRQPTPFIIFLRGINNNFLNKAFNKKLNWYTYKDAIETNKKIEIELASGCFMLCNTHVLKKIEGFSKKYFLYFEDFDISRKIRKIAHLTHLPEMKIIHHGGNTTKKSIKHKYYFVKAAFIYFLSNNEN